MVDLGLSDLKSSVFHYITLSSQNMYTKWMNESMTLLLLLNP